MVVMCVALYKSNSQREEPVKVGSCARAACFNKNNNNNNNNNNNINNNNNNYNNNNNLNKNNNSATFNRLLLLLEANVTKSVTELSRIEGKGF